MDMQEITFSTARRNKWDWSFIDFLHLCRLFLSSNELWFWGHRTIVRDLLHKEQLSTLAAVLSFCPSNLTSVMSASYTTYQLFNLRAFIPGSCPCQSRQHRSCCPQWRMGTQVGMCRQKQQEHQPKSKIHVTYGGDICRTKCRSVAQTVNN